MTTYHIYKTDCTGASRVMLQSGWENGQSVFIHRAKPGRVPTEVPEMPFALGSVLGAMKAARPDDDPPCFVFHAQSSLPLLLLAYLLRGFFGGRDAIFVYDIHDLHEGGEPYRTTIEKIRYGVVRHYILALLERIVLGRRGIRTLTVSAGLSRTIVDWYGCPAPTVVHSAMYPRRDAAELQAMPRRANALLFFGTPERLPVDLIDAIGAAGLELHLYGRFQGREGVEAQLGRPLPAHVQVFGEYSPDDLDFVGGYPYLLLFKPSDRRLNFRYSLPNKLFQSLGYGVSLILSENFEEMAEVLAPVSGGAALLRDSSELAGAMAELEKQRTDGYWAASSALARQLHDDAKSRYLQQTRFVGHG